MTLQELAADNRWMLLWPEISVGLLALLVLTLDLIFPKLRSFGIGMITLLGLTVILAVMMPELPRMLAQIDSGDRYAFAGMVMFKPTVPIFRVFFLLAAIGVSYLGISYLQKQNLPRTEFFILTLIVTAALMLLASANHFILFFVALETVTIGFYVLVGYQRNSALSLEAGLKYLILGALSSAILLFGIVLLYGAAGLVPFNPETGADTMNYNILRDVIAANPSEPLFLAGAVLVLSGVLFKIGAVPFQIWIPDVYQGAPTPVTAFLAISSKAAGFAVLINLVLGPFAALAGTLVPLMSAVAIITILYGNITACGERNLKRMMGLSGISHAGYLLLGVLALWLAEDYNTQRLAVMAIAFYLLVYMFASLGIFGVMLQIADDDTDQRMLGYTGLAQRNSYLSGVLTICLGSLAGIPPLAGFIGKLMLFIVAFQARLYWVLAAAILGVVISIYYYFGWIRESFEETEKSPQPFELGFWHKFTLGSLAAVTVVLGIYQGGAGI